MKPLFETRRLLVLPSSLDQYDDIYQLVSDPVVMRYVGRGVRTPELTRENLEKMISHQEKHGFSVGSVHEKETGAFVGRAGMIYLEMNDEQPEIEIGYVLHVRHWKKGYATELAKAILDWGFTHFKLNKLIAVLYPENDASRHVLEKAGMHYVSQIACYDIQAAKYELHRKVPDPKKLELVPASLEDYPVLQNMARFYVYDLSEYMDYEMPGNGLYDCIDFAKYWDSPDSFPFLIRYDNDLAGFAIIDKKGSVPGTQYNMAQFYLARRFKRKGLGRLAAYRCFDQFRGTWEIMVMPGNEGAYRFWRAVIKAYTKDRFVEGSWPVPHFENEIRNIFKFDSSEATLKK